MPNLRCDRPPRGWYCKLPAGHAGPCPARPRWWKRLLDRRTRGL